MSKKMKNQQLTFQNRKIIKILTLVGIFILISGLLLLKSRSEKSVDITVDSAEAQLDQFLVAGEPVFAFFHSNNCHSCMVMMDTVDEVYPEFQDMVRIVDVNVYDPVNQNLLKRAQIYSIPTQVFIDRTGQGKVTIGVMPPDQLKKELQVLANGES
jgi:thiol:disulfide interchange protein